MQIKKTKTICGEISRPSFFNWIELNKNIFICICHDLQKENYLRVLTKLRYWIIIITVLPSVWNRCLQMLSRYFTRFWNRSACVHEIRSMESFYLLCLPGHALRFQPHSVWQDTKIYFTMGKSTFLMSLMSIGLTRAVYIIMHECISSYCVTAVGRAWISQFGDAGRASYSITIVL